MASELLGDVSRSTLIVDGIRKPLTNWFLDTCHLSHLPSIPWTATSTTTTHATQTTQTVQHRYFGGISLGPYTRFILLTIGDGITSTDRHGNYIQIWSRTSLTVGGVLWTKVLEIKVTRHRKCGKRLVALAPLPNWHATRPRRIFRVFGFSIALSP